MTTEIQTEVLKRVDSILDGLATAVNATKDFAAEQLPDIAMQYVAFGRGYLTVYMLLGIALIPLTIWLWKKIDDWEEPAIGGGILTAFASLIILNIHTKPFIMVWLAPKVWLIQEIANLVKQ